MSITDAPTQISRSRARHAAEIGRTGYAVIGVVDLLIANNANVLKKLLIRFIVVNCLGIFRTELTRWLFVAPECDRNASVCFSIINERVIRVIAIHN